MTIMLRALAATLAFLLPAVAAATPYALGYAKIKNYDGSWNEWGNDPTLPAAR